MNMDDGTDGADGSPNLNCSRDPMSSTGLTEFESRQESYREDRPYKCNQCDKSYRHAGSLVNHKKTHQVGLYACLICQKEYSNPMGLKSHLRTHSEEKRFRCEQCGEAFRMSQQLYNHRKSMHAYYSAPNGEKVSRSPKFEVQSPVLVESSNLMTNLENYIAESMLPVDFPQLVSKYFPDEKGDERPVKEEAVEYEAFTDEKDQPNDSNVEEYRYKCAQCGKAYKHAGSLANHRQSHVIGIYQCAVCFKEFSNLMAMKNHCRLHSDSRARRSCKSPLSSGQIAGVHLDLTEVLQSAEKAKNPLCLPDLAKLIKSDYKDIVPMPESHYPDGPESSPSPFTKTNPNDVTDIPLCSDSMIDSTNEDEAKEQANDFPEYDEANEEDSKSGDRPFTCQECGKSYRHAGSLINHKKIHQTGVYSCSLCSKKMFNMAALKNHLRAHFKSKAGKRLEDAHFPSASLSDEIYQNQDDSYDCGNSDISTNETDFLKHHFLHQKQEMNEISIDKPVEDVPESGIWQETPQVSQGSSDDSAYSSGPAFPEAKMEVDNLAFQPWSREDSLATHHEVKLEHTDDDLQNADDSVAIPQPDPIALKEEESSGHEQQHQSPDDRPHKCELCGRTYRHKSSLINHKLTHKTGVYQCSLCPKQYPNLMALRNHVRFHSRSYVGRKSIASRQGHQFFRSRPRFLQSRNIHLLADSVKLNEELPQAVTTSQSAGEELVNEPQTLRRSGKSFENFHSNRRSFFSAIIKSPAKTPTDIQHTSPEKHFLKAKAEPHNNVTETSENQGRRVYKCNLCSKSYRHSGSLINHKRTHQTGDYGCPYCSKHVHNMAALKNHIRIHHKIKKMESEDVSNDHAVLYSDLSYRSDTKGVYGCVSCRETFHTEKDLLAHQMLHVEDNQWDHQGPKSSSTEVDKDGNFIGTVDSEWDHSNNLGFQDERDHLDSAVEDHEPEYTCVECGEVYDHIDDLNDHKRSHQAGIFQCSFCPKEFSSLSALRSHFETHTKPQTVRTTSVDRSDGNEFVENQILADNHYDCGHCGLVFSNEVDFHQHQVAHEKRQGMAEPLPAMQGEEQEPEFSFSMHSSERELLHSIKSEIEETERGENHDCGSQLSHICGFCGETYDDLESLQAHSFSHRNKIDSPANGNIPPETIENQQHSPKPKVEGSESSPKNVESPESRPYTCDQCGKTYRHGGSLVNHKKTHLVGNFQCVGCSRHYPNLAAYRTHLRHHPNCKSSAGNNLHELQISTLQDCSYLSGNERLLPFSLSLPGDFASRHNPEKCAKYSTSISLTSQTSGHKKNSKRRLSRQIGRIREDQATQTMSTQTTSTSIEDSKVQSCKLCGNMVRLGDLALHLSYNCVRPLSKLDGSLVECKEETPDLPILANSALSQNDRETGFQKRPFRCEVCNRSYRHAGSLINHKQTHKTGIFRCPICQKRFFNLMAMKNHNRIHFELKRHKCLDCGKAFRLQKQLDTHQRIHRQRAPAKKLGRRNRKSRYRRFSQGHHQKTPVQVSSEASSVEKVIGSGERRSASRVKREMDPDSRPYQCQECGRSYRHAGSLFNHKKSHKTGQYHCSICDKTYRNLMALKNHQRTHYQVKRHSCSQCGKTFKWRRQLVRHQLVHVHKESELDSVVPSGTEEANAIPVQQEVNPTMGHETSDFKNQDVSNEADEDVASHPCEEDRTDVSAERGARESAQSEEPHQCEMCGRTDHAGSLCTHTSTCESGKYKCSLCPKEFLNPNAMNAHLQTHSAEKPLQGVDCGQMFQSSQELISHNTGHIKGKAFQCPTCNHVFSCEVTLRHHQHTHEQLSSPQSSSLVSPKQSNENKTSKSDEKFQNQKDQGDRKYKCKQCGRSYLHASSLFNHQKTHSIGVYKCPNCLKEFFNLLAFKNHLRIHRYNCKECGKAFRNSSDLVAHSEIHEEGSFTCALCNKHFLCLSSLKNHQRIHDNQDGDILDPQAVSNFMVEVT
ncbi:zinc finger protein 646 [Anomaloglossus baeobatrachus]|uniref:zinc finger protein 646 n=1 Tax=Anomaloglossus baeobatrachus TaxID=238106 RepID=UPI003F4FFDE2